MAKRVLVTMKVPECGVGVLRRAGIEVDQSERTVPMGRGELLERAAGCDGLICMLADRIDAELMDTAPELAGIAAFAVGIDNPSVNRI